MTRNGEEEDLVRTASTSSTTRLRVRTDPFLLVCRGFSVITALTAILCIVVNVFSAIRSFKDGSDIFDGIFRCYAVGIAFFVVLAETEWGFILKFWKEDLILLQNISSYMLLACGVLYLASGLLCIGHLKRLRQKKEITRGQAVKDLEELERRREELEQWLVTERD